MKEFNSKFGKPVIFLADSFQKLIEALSGDGYSTVAPVVRDGAIILDQIESAEQLPVGYIDHQMPASYRLEQVDEESYFRNVVGIQSWKKYLYPPNNSILDIRLKPDGWKITGQTGETQQKFAFIGVRPCDLAAIEILDKILMKSDHPDPGYVYRRKNSIIIAVNCINPGENCFCSSMNTGPKAKGGFDLSLTEIPNKKAHCFLIETGSKKGFDLVSKMECCKASDEEMEKADNILQSAVQSMTRKIDGGEARKKLLSNLDRFNWKDVAKNCLSCGNCTMVCPTCFCTTIEDYTALNGQSADRKKVWDSCYSMDHSYIHGGSIRYSVEARYRQWITHKFANWIDQFGVSGCVGCGRCITWCPVGIDVTEEINRLEIKAETVKVKEK